METPMEKSVLKYRIANFPPTHVADLAKCSGAPCGPEISYSMFVGQMSVTGAFVCKILMSVITASALHINQ